MERDEYIDLSWGPKRLDLFLRKFYRHGLIYYAHILAESLGGSFLQPFSFVNNKRALERELKYINILFRELMNKLVLYCEKYPLFENYKDCQTYREKRNFIIRNFKLLQFLEILEKRESNLYQMRNILPEGIRGRPINSKTKIASSWAPVISNKGITSWSNVTRLLKWFYERLKNTDYRSEIYVSDNISMYRKEIKQQCEHILKLEKKSKRSKMDEKSELEKFKIHAVINRVFPQINRSLYSIEFSKEYIEIKTKADLVSSDDSKIIACKKLYGEKEDRIVRVETIKDNVRIPFIIFPDGSGFYSGSLKRK